MDPHAYRIAIDEAEIERLRSAGVKKILEVCCGDGTNLMKLAVAGFSVKGLDNENRYVGDGYVIEHPIFDEPFPFDEGFFDYIYSYQYINHNHKEKILKVFNEIFKTLRSGGIFALRISDVDQMNLKHVKNDLYEELDPEFGAMKYRMLAPQTYEKLSGEEKGIPHYAFRKDELIEVLRSIGFKRIIVEKIRWNLVAKCEK